VRTHPSLRALCVIGSLALATIGVATVSSGTGTDPELALWRVTTEVGDTSRTLRLAGEFPADDLVQLAYPLQVLVRDTGPSAVYIRFDLSAHAVTGVAPELADGLDADEAIALLSRGTAIDEAEELFVVEAGQPILSNPFPFDLGGSNP